MRKKNGVTSKFEDQDSDEFFIKNFSDEIEKGKQAASFMGVHLRGHIVRRTYFFNREAMAVRPPMEFMVRDVRMEGAGVVVLTSENGDRREFPSIEFSFKFRADYRAVICISKLVAVMFEVI